MTAAAGFVLAVAAILVHAPGFGYDEVRRPVAVLGAALVLAAGAASPRASSWVLRMSDVALLAMAVSACLAVNRTDAAAALFPAAGAWIFLRGTSLGWTPRLFLERHGLTILSSVGILFSGYGLCQALGADVLGFGTRNDAIHPVSTVGNTNYAGVLSAVFAVVGLAGAVFGAGRRRWTGAAAALLGALHVAASGSLGGLAGLGAGCVAFAILLIRRHGLKPAAVIPLVVLLAAVAPVANRVADRVSGIARGEDRTARVRLGLWKGTLRLASAHPVLGCGTGAFRAEFPPYRDADERRLSHEGAGLDYVEAEDPHQSYLAVLSESGPFALIAGVAALVLALISGFRRAREPDAALAVAAVAGLVTLSVSGLFNSLPAHLPFAVLAGILAGAASPAAAAAAPGRATRVAWRAAAVLLAVATIPWFVADVSYSRAMHTRLPAERLRHAQRAVDVLPGHWPARFQIAKSWRAMGEGEGTAQAQLRHVLTLHPNYVPAMIELAAGVSAEERERLLRRAEELAPEVLAQLRKR